MGSFTRIRSSAITARSFSRIIRTGGYETTRRQTPNQLLAVARSRQRNCCAAKGSPAKPPVLPGVSYRSMRRWQRRGVKPAGQRSLSLRAGSVGASRNCDCEQQRGREPGRGGRVNPGEVPKGSLCKTSHRGPVVGDTKLLTGLDQKVSGQAPGLNAPRPQMTRHRPRGTT